MTQRSILLSGIATALLIPPVVFCIAGLGDGMSVGAVLSACSDQYGARRQNLGVVALLGLFPIALLAGTLWLARRLRWLRLANVPAALSGMLPVLLVLVWTNVEFWPIFLPERVYPGFPHGLEFVLGPGFYGPAAMALGLSIHAALWRIP